MMLSWEPFLWFPAWAVYSEVKEKPKTKIYHYTLVSGSFNKLEKLCARLLLGIYKTSRSPHKLARILKVYTETLTEFSNVHHPDSLNNTALCPWNSSGNGNSGWNIHSKDRGEDEELLIALSPVLGSASGYVLSMRIINPPWIYFMDLYLYI